MVEMKVKTIAMDTETKAPVMILTDLDERRYLPIWIGGYEAAEERRESWEHTYDALARLVGGARDEIAVVENATRFRPRG